MPASKKIALIQLNTVFESKKTNHERAEAFIKKAASLNCDIAILPEMFDTGFSMNVSVVADSGETDSLLSKMAKKYGIYIIAGFAAKDNKSEKYKNIAGIYNPEGIRIASYTKMHPFPLVDEGRHYAAGEAPVIFDIDGMKSSVFICYDLRFPEVFRRVTKQVQAIFVIANWPSSRKDHWETLLKARAIENQCFVIGVNRIGADADNTYSGSSIIYNPLGNIVCSGNDTDEIVTGEIDPSEVFRIRSEFPFLNNLNP